MPSQPYAVTLVAWCAGLCTHAGHPHRGLRNITSTSAYVSSTQDTQPKTIPGRTLGALCRLAPGDADSGTGLSSLPFEHLHNADVFAFFSLHSIRSLPANPYTSSACLASLTEYTAVSEYSSEHYGTQAEAPKREQRRPYSSAPSTPDPDPVHFANLFLSTKDRRRCMSLSVSCLVVCVI